MTIKIIGKVHTVKPQETKKDFTFQEFWIETDSETQYPQVIPVQASGDKMLLVGDLKAGDIIEADVNIRGRVWNGKAFASFSLWKLDKKDDGNLSDLGMTKSETPW